MLNITQFKGGKTNKVSKSPEMPSIKLSSSLAVNLGRYLQTKRSREITCLLLSILQNKKLPKLVMESKTAIKKNKLEFC